MNSIRLVLAHDLPLLRAALRLLLEAQTDFVVVAEAGDPSVLVDQVRLTKPDVIVMVVSARSGFGAVTLESLRPQNGSPHIVAVSPRHDASFVRLLLASGASAYVCEQSTPKELSAAIRAAAQGQTYVDSDLTTQMGEQTLGRPKVGHSVRPPTFLSKRETEVLKLLARGFTNQQVADTLSLSVKTAETYRVRMTRKLGVKTRSELFRYAFEVGMIGPDQLIGEEPSG